MEIFFVLISISQILTSQNQSHQHINEVNISSTCKLETSVCVFYRNLSLIVIFQWGMRSEGLKKYLNICRFQLLVYRASVTSVNFVTWDQAKIKFQLALCHEIWLKICHLRSVKIKYPCQVAASAHTIIQCHCLFRSFIKILHVKIYINTSPFILNDNAIYVSYHF